MGKPFTLRNGLLMLSTEAPGGIYNSVQLKKIASLCEDGGAIAKATEDQRLALLVKPERVKDVAEALQSVGVGIRNYQDGMHQPTSCVGALCPEFDQDAMTEAMAVSKELAAVVVDAPLKIGINGCANCCVPTHTLDISIVGDSGGYRISLGGKNSQIPEMASFMAEGVPAAILPKMVAKIVQVYKELATHGASLQDVIEQSGSARFIDALAPYSQDAAAGGDDPFAASATASLADGGDEARVDIDPSALGDDDGTLAADVPIAAGSLDDVALADDELLLEDEALMSSALPADGEPQSAARGEQGDAASAISPNEARALGAELDDLELTVDDLAMDDGAGDKSSAGAPDTAVSASDELDLDFEEESIDAAAPAGSAAAAASAVSHELLADVAASLPTPESVLDEDLELEASAAPSTAPESAPREPALAGTLPSDELSSFEPMSIGDDETLADAAAAAAPQSAPSSKPLPSMPKLPPTSDSLVAEDAELAAEEVDEDEADAFESKLNEAIADEESMPPTEELHSESRLEAMKLVESGEELSLHDSLQVQNFDDLGIEDETDASTASELEAAYDGEEDELGAVAKLDRASARSAPAPSSESALGKVMPSAAGLDFTGIAFTAEGRISLGFANGAAVVLDPASLASGGRELNLGGTRIRINSSAEGTNVEVDGVGIFLPRQAA